MARLMEQLVVRVCLKPQLQDGFTLILLQTLTNFEPQGLNWKKTMRAGFCEVLRGGRQRIYREGVKGVSRDLLIGYEHCLIADHSTLSLTLGTNSNPPPSLWTKL